MFAVSWMSGFIFWASYIAIGALFCVIYTKFKAKDTYAYISGKLVKDYTGKKYISVTDPLDTVAMDEVTIVIFVMFLLWPFPMVITFIKYAVILFFKITTKVSVLLLRVVANGLPEVSIKKNK